MIYYAGIGARDTPQDVCRKMFAAGKTMADLGFCLRSGGARGADSAFECGVMESSSWQKHTDESSTEELLEIYLPRKGFNGHRSPLYGSCKDARMLAKKYHPRWDILSCLGRDFHARNVYQVLGRDLRTPSQFVLCWTEGGKVVGGTGQALRIAEDHDIPILNFGCHDDQYISDYILELAERNRA